MRKLNLFVLLLVAAFLVVGCTKNDSTALDNSGTKNSGNNANGKNDTVGTKTDAEISMFDYFLPDGSKAHFQGEGNEFAELDIEVAQPFENYVIIHENNGGSLVRHIYKIDSHTIFLMETGIIDTKQDFPSLEELNALEPINIYLEAPFTKGKSFNNWTIVDTDETLETPYKVFTDVFVIEMKENDIVNRKYFAAGFGEVKREAIMQTDDGELRVTSTLKLVDQ